MIEFPKRAMYRTSNQSILDITFNLDLGCARTSGIDLFEAIEEGADISAVTRDIILAPLWSPAAWTFDTREVIV